MDVSVGAKEKKVKLELMKKKDRKKVRKMKSGKFEISTKAKALWEECRRYVTCFFIIFMYFVYCISV